MIATDAWLNRRAFFVSIPAKDAVIWLAKTNSYNALVKSSALAGKYNLRDSCLPAALREGELIRRERLPAIRIRMATEFHDRAPCNTAIMRP